MLNRLLYFFVVSSMAACISHEEEYSTSLLQTDSSKENQTQDLYLLDSINESNQKNKQLTSLAFDLTKDVKKLQLLLEIKENHQTIDDELKRLTKRNLIIIPKLIYPVADDSLKNKKNTLLLYQKKLEMEIQKQITLLENIEKTSENIEFKNFAENSKELLQKNSAELKRL